MNTLKPAIYVWLFVFANISFGQNSEQDLRNTILDSFSVFEKVVKGKLDINALSDEQNAVWLTLATYTGIEGGRLNYGGIMPFEKVHLKKWKKW